MFLKLLAQKFWDTFSKVHAFQLLCILIHQIFLEKVPQIIWIWSTPAPPFLHKIPKILMHKKYPTIFRLHCSPPYTGFLRINLGDTQMTGRGLMPITARHLGRLLWSPGCPGGAPRVASARTVLTCTTTLLPSTTTLLPSTTRPSTTRLSADLSSAVCRLCSTR